MGCKFCGELLCLKHIEYLYFVRVKYRNSGKIANVSAWDLNRKEQMLEHYNFLRSRGVKVWYIRRKPNAGFAESWTELNNRTPKHLFTYFQ